MKRNFQALIVFHQFLIFATLVVESVTNSWMSPEMRSFLGIERSIVEDAADATSPSQIMHSVWWVATLISVLASVGVINMSSVNRLLIKP